MAYSTVKPGGDQYVMAFQNVYTKSTLKGVQTDNIAFLPVTVDCGNELKMTLLESDLEDYPGMFVKGDGKTTALQGTFAKYPTRMKQFPPRGGACRLYCQNGWKAELSVAHLGNNGEGYGNAGE